MMGNVPRLAHRCFHPWSLQNRKLQRNAFGVVCVKVQKCERCNTIKETIEPAKQEDVKELEEEKNEHSRALAG